MSTDREKELGLIVEVLEASNRLLDFRLKKAQEIILEQESKISELQNTENEANNKNIK
jgi:hypothetical protein